MTDSTDNSGLQKPKKPYSWLEPYKFKPGQSGNPQGKRHGETSVTAALRRQLAKADNANRIARALVQAGLAQDVGALKLILERIDGKVASELSAHVTGVPLVAPTQVIIALPPNGRDDPAHRPGFKPDDAPVLGDTLPVPDGAPRLGSGRP